MTVPKRRSGKASAPGPKTHTADLTLLSASLDGAACGIVVINGKGKIVLANREAERMFGYARAELMGQALEVLVPERFRTTHKDHRAQFAPHPKARGMAGRNLVGLHKSGREFPVEIGLTPVVSEDGVLVVSSVLDMTEQHRAEQALRESEQKVRNTQAQLIQAQKMEALGRLAGGIAHDFNNLLTAITGYADLLRSELPDGTTARGDVEEILQASGRAAALTRRLLAFSRRQLLEPRVIDLNELVTGIESMLRRMIGEDVNLRTTLSALRGRVRADPSQLEQVIMNLAVNARDAMPEGGTLTIGTADHESETLNDVRPGAYGVLSLTDTGAGMTDDVKARVFEPFFTTKPVGKGTGLGLAMVFGIVEQSGGQITLHSEVGKGTTFRIYLPRVEDQVTAVQGATSPMALRGTETILLVEDEEVVRSLARRALVQQGYTVLDALSGPDALKLCDAHPELISLLITDIVMPGMSGIELAERIAVLRPGIKMLYVSGYPDRALSKEDLPPGSAYMAKPFGAEALAKKVRDMLGPI